MRRWVRRLGLGLLGLLALAAAILVYLIWGSLPKTAGELAVEGIEQPVTIERDAFAVPTIRAQSLNDAYFAMGFVHGQDRLWQLEFLRRIAQGRLAEIVGPTALPADRFLRTLGVYEVARESSKKLSDKTLTYLEYYARGINAAIASFDVLPPEFLILRHRPEPWTITDSLAFVRLLSWDLGRNWSQEILVERLAQEVTPRQLEDLFPPQRPGTPTTYPSEQRAGLDTLDRELLKALAEIPDLFLRDPLTGQIAGKGSNIWVIGPDRTASQEPLLANDPHLALRTPGPFYLAQIETPELRLQGATMPSLPFMTIGRNDNIAWGLTNAGPDTQDLFIEKLDPDDPDHYLTPEGRAAFQERIDEIEVRGQDSETLTVRTTRHGPVISDVAVQAGALIDANDHVIALAWTGLDEGDIAVEAGFALAEARDWAGFREALRSFGAPMQNVGYADRDGHIGMISPGTIPIRKNGDGIRPVQGWTGEFDWIGTIPFNDLPQSFDPPDDKLVNANNILVGPNYPYLLTKTRMPALRARRIETLLAGQDRWTSSQAANMQLDLESMLAHDFLQHLLDAADRTSDLPVLQSTIIEALSNWDKSMSRERPEPLIFSAWYEALARTLYGDELGPLFTAYRGVRADFVYSILSEKHYWCDDVETEAVEPCDKPILEAFNIALEELRDRWGDDWRSWRWDNAHRAIMPHNPFHNIPTLAWLFDIRAHKGGDSATINVGHWNWNKPFDVTLAPTLRTIMAPSQPTMRAITATGQVGHPFSRHYDDLTRLWSAGEMIELNLEDRAEHRSLTLLPVTSSD